MAVKKEMTAKQKAEYAKKVKALCVRINKLNKELADLSKELDSHLMNMIEV